VAVAGSALESVTAEALAELELVWTSGLVLVLAKEGAWSVSVVLEQN
jgi:hypothetical protein